MSFSIKGKHIVLVGSEHPILMALAGHFAGEGANLHIIEHTKSAGALADVAAGLGAGWCCCDTTDSATVDGVFSQAVADLGGLDALVFCVCRGDGHTSLEETEDALWDVVVTENQTAAFYCSRTAARMMDKQGSGSILYIASVAGVSGAAGTAFASVSHGLISMCRNTAILFSGKGLRCNVLCPGPIVGVDGCTDATVAEKNAFGRKMSAHVDWELPPVTAEDIAAAAQFFLSDEAAAINGQWLQIDRGYAC